MKERDVSYVKLQGGAVLALNPDSSQQSVAIRVRVDVGSRDDARQGKNGVGHFLEHILFKRTKGFTTQERNNIFDAMSAQPYAVVNKDHTYIYTQCAPEDTEEAIKLLFAMLTQPLFTDEDIEKERNVIRQEIGRDLDNTAHRCSSALFRVTYGDTSMGTPGTGTLEDLEKITLKDIEQFYECYYVLANYIIAVAGDFNREKVIAQITQILVPLNPGQRRQMQPYPYVGGVVRTQYDEKQSHVYIAFESLSRHSDLRLQRIQAIAMTMLGAGESFRLYANIRQKDGLVYAISAGQVRFNDLGLCYISFDTAGPQVDMVIRKCIDQLVDLAVNMSMEEFERARSKSRKMIYMNDMTPLRVTEAAAADFYYFGGWITWQELLEVNASITIEETKKFLCEMLYSSSKPTLACTGDIAHLMSDNEFYHVMKEAAMKVKMPDHNEQGAWWNWHLHPSTQDQAQSTRLHEELGKEKSV